jgi:hypothetical protein
MTEIVSCTCSVQTESVADSMAPTAAHARRRNGEYNRVIESTI